MVGKNKKGGASYLRKWRRRLVSILFKILRWIFSVERVILLFAGGLMVLVVYEFFWWQTTEFFEVENAENAKSSQLLILTLGSIGVACGLILVARRSAKFSEQVDTAQKQVEIAQKQADTRQKLLFNEQLGRGAELLANKEMVVRQTGIRVFGNLAERTIGEPEQVKLIMQIIHDFVLSKTSSPSKDRNDVALGIRTLVSLYNESGRRDDFREVAQFRNCHLEGLNFTNANLQGVDFWDAQLQGACFYKAKLEWADCSVADFSDDPILTRNHVNGMIFLTDHRPILPKRLEQFLDKRRSYEFEEGPDDEPFLRRRFVKSDAEWSGKDVDEWVAKYLASIRDPEDAS